MFPRPWREDVREAVEIYPIDPRPSTVEVMPEVLRNPAVAKPTTVLVSSVGSIMLLILELSPATVDVRVAEEIYPVVPRP